MLGTLLHFSCLFLQPSDEQRGGFCLIICLIYDTPINNYSCQNTLYRIVSNAKTTCNLLLGFTLEVVRSVHSYAFRYGHQDTSFGIVTRLRVGL
jgi:hypothetical protein